MYGIYCTEARGCEVVQGLNAVNVMHPAWPWYNIISRGHTYTHRALENKEKTSSFLITQNNHTKPLSETSSRALTELWSSRDLGVWSTRWQTSLAWLVQKPRNKAQAVGAYPRNNATWKRGYAVSLSWYECSYWHLTRVPSTTPSIASNCFTATLPPYTPLIQLYRAL